MFLFRTAFWLAVIIMLLPTDEKQQARFAAFAVSSVHHVATFCERNVRTCEVGSDLWAVFLRKLDYGSRLAMDLINDRAVRSENAAVHPTSMRHPEPARVRGSTLTPTDRAPPWRGSGARTGA